METVAIPLRAKPDGTPIIYAALGVQLHLESPEPSQVGAYEQALEAVIASLGQRLRWTHSSSFGEPERYQPDDLSYVVEHVRSAHPRSFVGDSLLGNRIASAMEGELALVCHGGEEDWQASPYSFRYYAQVPDNTKPFVACAMLRVTLPTFTPLDVFKALVVRLATTLPVRWGTAGLMMSGWEIDRYQETHDAMYAIARRYPGYDPGFYASKNRDQGRYPSQMALWHEQLRTVSWLTFLGPALLERLREAERLVPGLSDGVMVEQLGAIAMLQAGPQPEAGDGNRLDYPSAYCQADRLVRPIRASNSTHFLAPWTKDDTQKWLRRFEAGGLQGGFDAQRP